MAKSVVCKKHPKYKAKLKPVGCEECWWRWIFTVMGAYNK